MFRKLAGGTVLAFALAILSLGLGSRPAAAEVIFNERIATTTTTDNPCEPGISPIVLHGTVHHVWYTTPEGGLKMNIQGHLTGMDTDGTKYILNFQRHMEHFAYFDPLGNLFPFDDRFTNNLISRGTTVNAQIVITFTMSNSLNPAGNPNAVTVIACRG